MTVVQLVLPCAGLAGSVLEAKLNRTSAPAWYCARKTDGFRVVWLSLSEASRPVCLLDELAVFYNATTERCGSIQPAAADHIIRATIRTGRGYM